MQRIKGRLSNLEDLIIFIDRLRESGGRLELYLPLGNEEIVICHNGINFILASSNSEFPEKKAFKIFIEKWLLSGIEPMFEFYEGEVCSNDSNSLSVSEEELFQILNDPYLKSVKDIPHYFEVTKIDVRNVPSFLVAHWKTQRPVNRDDVYKYGSTLSDIVRYVETGMIEIKPFINVKSFPYKLRLFLQALAFITVAYISLPIGYMKLTSFKVFEAANWGLKEKIVGHKTRKELPVKGCFKTKFYLIGNKVVNSGIDGVVGTDDDISFKLPEKGYIPVFAFPVK